MISNGCTEENFPPTLLKSVVSTPSANKRKIRLGKITIYLGINARLNGCGNRLPSLPDSCAPPPANRGSFRPNRRDGRATRPAFSDPSQPASEVIASVGGGAAVTAAWVGMGGHELGGDGGGGAAHQSKEEYSDAEP